MVISIQYLHFSTTLLFFNVSDDLRIPLLYGVSLLLFLAVNLLIIYRNRSIKRRKSSLLSLILLHKMNDSSFLTNSVRLAGLAVSKDHEVAEKAIPLLTSLINRNSNTSNEVLRPLKEELELVLSYLDIEKMINKWDFEVHATISPTIEHNVLIPQLIIFSMIENHISSHFRYMRKGKLELRVDQVDSDLIIEIEDNGIGKKRIFELDHPSKEDQDTNFEIYLDLLNRFSKLRIEYNVEEKVDVDLFPTGTRININIPVPFECSYDFVDSYDKLVGSN